MRRSLFSGIAAGLLAVALPAFSATQMEELAQTLHDNEFSAQVEKLIKNGRSAQALELAGLGLERNNRNAQLRFMRAVALETLGRKEESAKELRSLISAYPEIPEPYNNLAVIEAGFGNLEESLRLLTRALQINPDFQLARKNVGDVYLALAIEAYEASAPSFPRNAELQTRLKTLKRITASGL